MSEPVAVVGMGMRLPGGIRTAEELWRTLIEKRSTRSEIPASRFSVDGFHSASGRAGSVAMRYGHFLEGGLGDLDTSLFSMGRREVDDMDPQQRMLLEVVYECMQGAGQVGWRGTNIGCYVGVWGEDWLDLRAKDSQDSGMYRIPGGHDFAISNRVSYEFDLRGPSFTIKAGCSSSLIALHEAVRALRAGDCEGAIVAGTNLILSPTMSIGMTEQGVLATDGRCKSFDAAADGYGRGEAVNAVYLKLAGDAVRHGDTIHGVVRATAANCDGKTPGMSMPSSESHEALMRRAYGETGLDPGDTAFVEAHGTGTAVGDPLEATAIARVFGGGEETLWMGSVKPNLGHSEGASGVSSLIKAVLALKHQTIPPNIHYSSPNPRIPWAAANMAVPINEMAWPEGRPLRASVNSFGIGGANAHAVVEGWEGLEEKETPSLSPSIFLLSAANTSSLRQSIADHQEYLETNPSRAADVSYTLGSRRDHLAHRAFAVSSSTSLQFSPPARAPKTPPGIVMVFTGQGAQWMGMARELLDTQPSFAADIDELSAVLAGLPDAPIWDLGEVLRLPDANINRAEIAQPLVCAVQVALVRLLARWGVHPAAVVGHSSGEVAAAFASGALSAAEAITVAYYRGLVTRGHRRPGGMAAVGLGRDEAEVYLQPGVVLACDNSPSSVTLSGDKEALDSVCESIKSDRPDCFVRPLVVEMAYHSHHMLELGAALESSLEHKIHSRSPAVPFYSSVRDKVLSHSGVLDAPYWRENLESPVLFRSAVQRVLASTPEPLLLVEIGPHSALAGPLRQVVKYSGRSDAAYASALVRSHDASETVLRLAGELFVRGVEVAWDKVTPRGHLLTDLPLYAWRHEGEFWAESRVSRQWRQRPHPHHELLGSRTLEGTDVEPQWRNLLRLEQVPWLRDHQVGRDVVFPCAGYVAMAVEAIQRLNDSDDFALRNVLVQTALVLSERPVEMVTSLRPVRLTDSLASVWWEFGIVSHNGSAWVKHCTGQIRGGQVTGESHPLREAVSYPRPVDNIYPALAKIGLHYGPAFRGLESVSCLPGRRTAAATLLETASSESSYAVHPTTIDHCLQLFVPASCDGILYRADKLCVPTGIDRLYVKGGTDRLGSTAEAVAETSSSGALSGSVTAATSDGDVFLSLEGGRFSPLETEDDSGDSLAAAQLVWKPHLDLVDPQILVRPDSDGNELALVEELTLLAILEIDQRMEEEERDEWVDHEHLDKYRAWIHAQKERGVSGEYDQVAGSESLASLPRLDRLHRIAELRRQIEHSDASSAGELIGRILDRSDDILVSRIDGIELLQPGGGLAAYYDHVDARTDATDFFAAAGHTRPTLRVLEIGAGTGGGTSVVLQALTTATSARMYSTYTYTDISAGFFVAAGERFRRFAGLDFRVLDISRDPIEQGFEAASFDLIVAGNVLHATPNLHETLTNVHRLLAPGGRLFLRELSPHIRSVNLIMGILPGWWLGADDGRVDEPFVDAARWDELLQDAGFSVDAVVYDAPRPFHINANIIARPALPPSPPSHRRITLLHLPGDEFSSAIQGIRSALTGLGLSVDLATLHDDIPDNQDIVAALEINVPFLEAISAADLTALQRLVRGLAAARLLWLTRPAQHAVDADPGFGMALGLARTLRSEQLVRVATLEVDYVDGAAYDAVARVFSKYCEDHDNDNTVPTDPESEFVLFEGVVSVPRYHAVSSEDLAGTSPPPEAVKLEIGRLGLLSSLRWVPAETREPGPGEVVVEPRCAGLNFRDILLCMGIVEANSLGIGLEGSGVVVAVGPGVIDLEPGHRVFYLDQDCFSTRLVLSALRCARIPDSLGWEQAASMPCVYATVLHALVDVGRLAPGMSVLIHSACGGIGIAAMNLCQAIGGVEIFATVGNEQKVRHLTDTFGLSRRRIFNSRDASFLPDVLAATAGRGVDLVLNSLSGELLHASWRCVAPYGKMLEIGKRDFIGRAQLDMDVFEANRSFVGIDLARFDGGRCQPLLARTAELFASRSIRPIGPLKSFPAARIEESFRYMQKGTHLGKIVVSLPEHGSGLSVAPPAPDAVLDPEASYLLVGGLGGLGRAVATWLVGRGARHLVFLSRSAGTRAEDLTFFEELHSQECTAVAVAGSVTDIADVDRAVAAAVDDNENGSDDSDFRRRRRLGGVLQMSMVLRDRPFIDMTSDDWDTAVAPKVQGSWNLHRVLLDRSIRPDFFFATGSVSGSFGTPGQANYAAANTFLNAFVQYRRSLGLPASVLHIGLVDGVGYLAQNPARADALRAAAGYFLTEKDLLDGLGWALSRSADDHEGQLTIGLRCSRPLSDPANRVIWKKDPRMAMYHVNGTASQGPSTGANKDSSAVDDAPADALRAFLAAAARDPNLLAAPSSAELVAREVGARICAFMLRPAEDLDPAASLTALGVDSLVTIEIRNWLKRCLGGLELSTLEILNAGTVAGLGRLVVDSLKQRLAERASEGDAYLTMKAP